MLQDANVQFNGVVFLSSVLNFGLTGLGGFNPIGGGDWAYVLYLPTEAAAAWYHHRVPDRPADLHTFLAQVQAFASGEYLHALARRRSDQRLRSATALSRRCIAIMGLSETYLRNSKMRVPYYAFQKATAARSGQHPGPLRCALHAVRSGSTGRLPAVPIRRTSA